MKATSIGGVWLTLATGLGAQAGSVLYVDDDAPPGGGGSCWDDAYEFLQDALTHAAGDPAISEIWVAEGVYLPDRTAKCPQGSFDKNATFQLLDAVALYGGFAGGEISLEQRVLDLSNPDPAHGSVLSGDLNQDDRPGFVNDAENSRHVLTGSGTNVTAALDGFTIRGGNVDTGGVHDGGGGIIIRGGDPTLRNCRFIENRAQQSGRGGALWSGDGSNTQIVNCIFFGNQAASTGGAVSLDWGGVPQAAAFINCLFTANHVPDGAFDDAHAIFVEGDDSTTLTNCTFANNGNQGPGSVISAFAGAALTVTNCVVRGFIFDAGGTATTVTYTCIETWAGRQDETNLIDVDPLFVDADGVDDVAGTLDDDFRLLVRSPCIEAGHNASVPLGVAVDLDGSPRIADGDGDAEPIVDMGAYERLLDCPVDTLDRVWSNPDGGVFHLAANWVPEFLCAPGPTNAALFFEPADYTVTFGKDVVNRRLRVCCGAVTFDLNGATYELLATGSEVDVTVGEFINDDAGLSLTDGLLLARSARIGDQPTATGTLSASGSNASLMLSGAVSVGHEGAGTLAVSGGASATSLVMIVGERPGSTGAVTVSDPGSVLFVEDDLCVGCGGDGTLSITNGASATSFVAAIGDAPDSTGSVLVTGAGSSWDIPLFLLLQDGLLTVESGASVTMGPGGLIVLEGGVLAGDGLLSGEVINVGTISPSAILTIEGNYLQFSTLPSFGSVSGSLSVEIGGEVPGRDHDQLQVTGAATLSGGLFVDLTGDFEPQTGDEFLILDAATTLGRFDVAFLPGLADGFMRVTYGAGGAAGSGTVTVEVTELLQFIEFGGPEGTNVPDAPSDAVAGDFNGDTFDDLAITIPAAMPGTEGSVLVLLSNGSGIGFMSTQQITVGVDPSSITLGLLDADTSLDLAVANAADNDVTVIFNMGDGSGDFIDPNPGDDIPVGDNPVSIAAGNLHGQVGKPPGPGEIDLVTANRDDNTITVLFNDGSGGFPSIVPLPGGDGPGSVNPTDLDNDKDLDIALTVLNEGTVHIFENPGDGGFGGVEAIALPVGSFPVDLVAADLDLDVDGLVDLVTANLGDGTLSVILNNGGLDLAPAVDLPVGDEPVSITALDMEGDGDVDLAAVVKDGDGNPIVVSLRNDLNGGEQLAFAEPEDLMAAPGTLFVLNGDLDGDGDDDLITVNVDDEGGLAGSGPEQPFVSILPNLADIPLCPTDTDGNRSTDVVDLVNVILAWGSDDPAADVNNDGIVDVEDLVMVILAWGPCP